MKKISLISFLFVFCMIPVYTESGLPSPSIITLNGPKILYEDILPNEEIIIREFGFKELSIDEEQTLLNAVFIETDDFGRIVYMLTYDATDESTVDKWYRYDTDGRMIEEYIQNPEIPFSVYEYSGNVIYERQPSFYDGKIDYEQRIITEKTIVDEKLRPVSIEHYSFLSGDFEYGFNYYYDGDSAKIVTFLNRSHENSSQTRSLLSDGQELIREEYDKAGSLTKGITYYYNNDSNKEFMVISDGNKQVTSTFSYLYSNSKLIETRRFENTKITKSLYFYNSDERLEQIEILRSDSLLGEFFIDYMYTREIKKK